VAEKVAGRDSGRGGRGNRKSVEKLRLWLKCARSGKEGVTGRLNRDAARAKQRRAGLFNRRHPGHIDD
jgi:hypothetical protein